ncbi:hypothetical protein GCM10025870_22520 [Agromyces marinus]|uniref:Uncharacterized protein n=1 Tax=Agromyces marinus TaxID=1389020 RepID=A0ABM8H301_9MICO|nr:hypothetical protein GCM10025870_22520 [Agromyces marinus]
MLAVAMLAVLVVGAVIASTGLLAATGSPLQTALFATGAAVGGLGWVAFPVWWLVLASTVN